MGLTITATGATVSIPQRKAVVGIGVLERRRKVSRATQLVSGFFHAQRMAPILADHAGESQDSPVLRPVLQTPYGLPPVIGVTGGRFQTCYEGANHG